MAIADPRQRGNFGQEVIIRRPSNPAGAMPDGMRPDDDPFTPYSPLVKTIRLRLPVTLATASPWTLVSPTVVARRLTTGRTGEIGFTPQAVEIINWSANQGIRLSYTNPDISQVVNDWDFYCPPRYFSADLIDPVEGNTGNIAIAIAGYAEAPSRLAILRFYSKPPSSLAYGYHELPEDFGINAMEAHEKGTLITGTTLAAGATDANINITHNGVGLLFCADTAAMQFTIGTDAATFTDAFTVFAGEKESVSAIANVIKVKNIDTVPGGYRIHNIYQSQTP